MRREVSVSSNRQPGKFSDLYEMRTFQETVLEMAKSRQVLSDTLKAVRVAEDGDVSTEPTPRQIESLRKRLSLLPPGGAEFGKTEMFYLSVKDPSRERAVVLVNELCSRLDARLRQLRDDRAQSVIGELVKQFEIASLAHQKETARLVAFESEIGSDLGELRMLHSASSGQSDMRQEVVSLANDQRRAETQLREAKQLLEVLHSAQEDPEQLIALPSSLLVSQPTLRGLKDGLMVAQLRAARLAGTRTEHHPQVQAAKDSVEQIRRDFHAELQVAVNGVEIEIGLYRDQAKDLAERLDGIQQRLSGLAERRAEYSNRVLAVENSRAVLDSVGKQLGEVRASQMAAQTAQLVTPVDQPEVGANPVGLGRKTVVFLGALSGLVLGMGWLFLTLDPLPVVSNEEAVQSRWTAATETQLTSSEAVVPADRTASTLYASSASVDAGASYEPPVSSA